MKTREEVMRAAIDEAKSDWGRFRLTLEVLLDIRDGLRRIEDLLVIKK